MYTTYFDEYQKQFGEWQKQLSDWQKKTFDAWFDSLPNKKGDVDFSESFDKTIEFQEQLVNSYLETQEKTTRMMLDAQRKLWNDYFEALHKKSTKTTVGISN